MTPVLALWILSALASTGFDCQLPAREWAGDPVIAQALEGKPQLLLEPPLKDELAVFMERFDQLYSGGKAPTQRALLQARQWATRIGKLPDADQNRLMAVTRRWIALFLRDVSPQLDKVALSHVSKRLETFETIFSERTPLMVPALCLDSEVTASREEAESLRAKLVGLRTSRQEIAEFSEDMERYYLARIKENPAAPDRIFPYAAFLFAADRLEEAQAQIKQVLSLDAKYPDGERLRNAIAKALGLEDSVKRTRYIQAVVGELRAKAEAEYKDMLKRRPADQDSGKSVLAPAETPAPDLLDKIPYLPPKP